MTTHAVDRAATLYCDMDGVLADFFAGAQRIFARYTEDRIPAAWIRQSRSMAPTLRELEARFGRRYTLRERAQLDIKPVRQFVLSAISFGAGEFFRSLPPHEDGVRELWPFLQGTGLRVCLLTAPITNRKGVTGPTAAEGKRDWAARWLRPPPAAVVIRPSKHKTGLAAQSGRANLLIDDRPGTVGRWTARGGVGVLHHPGRSARTIARLRALGL